MSTIKQFDYSVNLLKVILWQYDKAERLKAWLQFKQDNLTVNHTNFWNDWYTNVFNINTASLFGVSVWAIILDVPLLINIPPINPDKVGFGFGEFRKNFNNGNFNVSGSSGGAQLLTIEQKRIAIKMRYQYLTTRGTVPEINQILKNSFGDLGIVYVEDHLDMTTTYRFGFTIEPWITFLFTDLNVFPTPAGVSAQLLEI